MSFSEERKMIEARRDEIDSEAAKIEELINHLDEQKYESIKLTFDKVSENFSLVFKKLGTGFISSQFNYVISSQRQIDS